MEKYAHEKMLHKIYQQEMKIKTTRYSWYGGACL
jgi:hypothetical protein